ncbi:guanylate kinase [Cetobacterium sp. SF1]|uniref:guanylate kinase n=1 Tax=Cetobacterium sp. SF1 TaxID=3417654 RepID=UPI003CF3C303
MVKGKLFIVSGPSGAGKSTICRLVRKMLGINLATSATTRAPRVGEEHGRDYYFLSKEDFLQRIENGEFLEHATVHGNYYGTLKSEVEARLAKGENVILEIDVQGGLQVKDVYPEANLIFFKTPSKEDLEKRLRGRKTDSEETIQLRLANSLKELEFEKDYDTTIINYTVEKSCEELINIIKSKNQEER